MTVIDAAEFYTNLDSMKEVEQGETTGTIAELLMEQVRDIFFLDNPGLKLELQTNHRQSSHNHEEGPYYRTFSWLKAPTLC